MPAHTRKFRQSQDPGVHKTILPVGPGPGSGHRECTDACGLVVVERRGPDLDRAACRGVPVRPPQDMRAAQAVNSVARPAEARQGSRLDPVRDRQAAPGRESCAGLLPKRPCLENVDSDALLADGDGDRNPFAGGQVRQRHLPADQHRDAVRLGDGSTLYLRADHPADYVRVPGDAVLHLPLGRSQGFERGPRHQGHFHCSAPSSRADTLQDRRGAAVVELVEFEGWLGGVAGGRCRI